MRKAYSDRTSKIVEGKLKGVGGTSPIGKPGFIFELKRLSDARFHVRENFKGEDN
tara:strand:- start:1845 stop:2009 length:165 start_codon:yes stop_codon:yes gene_type:complete